MKTLGPYRVFGDIVNSVKDVKKKCLTAPLIAFIQIYKSPWKYALPTKSGGHGLFPGQHLSEWPLQNIRGGPSRQLPQPVWYLVPEITLIM